MAPLHSADLTRISLREYRSLFDKGQSPESEDAILAKVFGFESADVMLDEISQPEFKRLMAEMLKQARDPVESDPKN